MLVEFLTYSTLPAPATVPGVWDWINPRYVVRIKAVSGGADVPAIGTEIHISGKGSVLVAQEPRAVLAKFKDAGAR